MNNWKERFEAYEFKESATGADLESVRDFISKLLEEERKQWDKDHEILIKTLLAEKAAIIRSGKYEFDHYDDSDKPHSFFWNEALEEAAKKLGE